MERINPQIYKNAYKWQFEAYPFYTSVYNKAAGLAGRKYFTSFDRFISYFHEGQLYAFVPRRRINKTGNKIIRELIAGNEDFLNSFEQVHSEMREVIRLCLEAREKRAYADLEKWWPAAQKALSDVCSILFNFDFTLDKFLLKLQKESESDFNLLRQSIYTDIPSFIDEAKKELLKLNKKYSGDIKKIRPEFIKKFGWFQNSYKEKFTIDEKWLKKYLDEIKLDNEAGRRRRSCAPPKKFGLLAEAAKFGITFRDDKKKLLLVAVDLMEPWLKNICKKNGWKYKEVRWLTMEEVLLALKGKKKKYYLEKAKGCALKNTRYGLMTPVGYDDISPAFWKKVYELNYSGAQVKELKGVPANKGICRGKVKVVLDPKASLNFQDGDILATSMTRPEFLPLMKRAAAFITDEGGITCHAAIVAREMNKPCIIGTKIATKVLKDGDLVEVDAEKGVVKILN